MKIKSFIFFFILFIGFNSIAQSPKKPLVKLDSLSIFYTSAKSEIQKKDELFSYFNKLNQNFNGKIAIIGYTDTIGSTTSNQVLASKRIREVYNLITSSKIDSCKFDTINQNENFIHERFPLNQQRRVDIIISRYEIQRIVKKDLPKIEFELNKPVKLNIQFLRGTTTIEGISYPNIEALIQIMTNDPTLLIKLNGHVCCIDDQEVSFLRAEAVKYKLISAGISKKRITTEGFSNRFPIVPETSEKNREINRRVEAVFSK